MKDSQRFIAIINTAIRYCKWLIVILSLIHISEPTRRS